MLPRKPYEKKPLKLSERDNMVLDSLRGFMIWTISNDGEHVIHRRVEVIDAGQCVAAMRVAKETNQRLLVYAIGEAYGDKCLCLVDEDTLLLYVKA